MVFLVHSRMEASSPHADLRADSFDRRDKAKIASA